MLFNATFKNISVISWRTVLLVEACSGFFKGYYLRVRVRIMVFNATFINISVISWQTVLLVEACSGFFKG